MILALKLVFCVVFFLHHRATQKPPARHCHSQNQTTANPVAPPITKRSRGRAEDPVPYQLRAVPLYFGRRRDPVDEHRRGHGRAERRARARRRPGSTNPEQREQAGAGPRVRRRERERRGERAAPRPPRTPGSSSAVLLPGPGHRTNA